ncbi:uncharacterized protein LOC115631014 [Scaptodrosophila lebanonensis]|uniref:Uncharacterized protein LOC115631014 n=1 Tax=Drosophila lebanonensis TaxID=7225 RepID=A0A6J2U546_DROLE|nr:uncharacterized protein LOC115631014 [Scaptodrosophila lebanonensis]
MDERLAEEGEAPRLTIKRKMVLDVDNLFPMSSKVDPSKCRDEYLADAVKPYEKIVEEVERVVRRVHGSSLKGATGNMTVEEILFREMEMHDEDSDSDPKKHKKVISEEAKAAALDIMDILQIRYDDLIQDMRRVCINFQLEQLKFRMVVLREMWPGDPSVLPYRMFGWSVEDYFRRFEQPNTLYIDVMEMELSNAEMECLKFRMDLDEVLRLIDSILVDIKNNRDLCRYSMSDMLDTKIDIEEVLNRPRAKLLHEHDEMTLDLFQYKSGQRSAQADQKRRNLKALQVQQDYYDPIERRYLVNWTYSTMEQVNYSDDQQCQLLLDELNNVTKLIKEENYVFQCSNQKYYATIEEYKNRIYETQMTYDVDLETAENNVQITRNKLQKAKDDLKFYKEQIKVFHEKIAHVRELIAMEEAAEIARVAKLAESLLAGPKKGKGKDKAKGKGKGKDKK